MGTGWRRVNEMVLQKWPVNGAKFQTTSNKRCEMMFREATRFAGHLKKLEANIRRLHRDIEVMVSDTRNIMLYSLPRTYDFTPSGQAVPDDPDPQLIGQNVQLDRFAQSIQILKQRMEEEVLEPLTSWMQAFIAAQTRMKRLEGIRLELDSRRRTVEILYGKAEKQKSSMGGGGMRAQHHHDDTLKKMHHKENKKNATMAAFQEHEAQVYQALYTLIKDTACFRDYTALAYNILEETFRVAYKSFEGGSTGSIVAYVPPPSPAPVPSRVMSPTGKSTKKGFLRSLLRGGWKTDSAHAEESRFYNDTHAGSAYGYGDGFSTGTGEETQTDIIPGSGAAGRYGWKPNSLQQFQQTKKDVRGGGTHGEWMHQEL
ncbi:hypothetical protein BSKO_00995 [Bryopsis sp. KO-2023]|nr:hypothetical protein BSKO_00995 [Bryopsis sp. KO-2023]